MLPAMQSLAEKVLGVCVDWTDGTADRTIYFPAK